MDSFLSLHLCRYRKGFSTQTALSSLIEKWKAVLDRKRFSPAILMDLSKAFDIINHELLLEKLHAYGFSKGSLQVIFSYLSERWQHVKINSTFSSWSALLQGVPQGSFLWPLLFNIYLNDLFSALKEIDVCNFAENTTPFVCDMDLNIVIKKLEENSALALTGFECHHMKLSSDKCHLLVSGNHNEEIFMKTGGDIIWKNSSVKLLGMNIDRGLKVDKHINDICAKANHKLSVLSRMCSFLCQNKKRVIFKSFAESQFKYYSLTILVGCFVVEKAIIR